MGQTMKGRASVLAFSFMAVAGAGYASGQSRTELVLMDAVKTGNREAVQKLLLQKIDVNHAQADGTTALHWAAHLDDVEIATALLRAGAAADTRNRYRVAPLMLAASNGSAGRTQLLLAAGADPRAALPEGETPLMAAASTGNAETLRLLMAHGADVNAREGWHGQTALMWAAAENRAQAVEALIGGGADLHARSNGGVHGAVVCGAVRADRRDPDAAQSRGRHQRDRPREHGTAATAGVLFFACGR